MNNNTRLLELALKGLEAERQRIDDEMSEIHEQLGSRAATVSAASQARAAADGQSKGNLTPAGRRKLSEMMRKRWAQKRKAGSGGASMSAASAQANKPKTGGNLTPAGRKKLADMMRKRWAAKRKAAKAGR